MLIYATPEQYAEWLELAEPPAGATGALRAASIRVGEMLLTSCYDVEETGYPSDPDQLQATVDATCALAAAGRVDGDSTGDGASPYQSVGVGSAQLSRGNNAGSASTTVPGADRAYAILQLAGLLPGGIWARLWTSSRSSASP